MSLGTAFANVRMLQHGAAYFPGLSLSQGERCDVNFGQVPFVYPVDGHKPLQAPPPTSAESYFRIVTCALARLLLLRLQRCSNGGGAGMGLCGEVSREEAAAVERRLRAFLADAHAADVAAAAEAHVHSGAQHVHTAAAAGAAAAGQHEVPVWPGDDTYALLSGLVGDHLLWLVDHSEWWLHAHMLPLVVKVHGLEPPHASASVCALMQLCQMAMPPEGFGRLVAALGRVLGHYASMAPFQRPASGQHAVALHAGSVPGIFKLTGFSDIKQLAHTGAYPFTAALVAVVALPDAASAWAYGPQWLSQMEAVLTRKLPTLDDLKELMPHVPKFTPTTGATGATGSGYGNGSGSAMADAGSHRVRMQGGDAFRADVRQLTAAMRGLEANQMTLAAAAADAAPPAPGVVSASSAAAAAAAAPPLLRLVRHVLRRNRYISSSSPPPGLSDGTVLTSLFYLLLRMLQPYASGSRPSHSLRHFPAGRLFVHSAAAAPPPLSPVLQHPAGGVGPLAAPRARAPRSGSGAAADDGVGEVLSDLIRVGGLLSHLHREARVCDELLQRHGGRVEVPEWAGPRRGAAGHGCPPGPGGAGGDDDGAAPPLADEWLPELLAAALVLYTWRVSGSVQSGTAMAGVMEANIGGMQVGGGVVVGGGGVCFGVPRASGFGAVSTG